MPRNSSGYSTGYSTVQERPDTLDEIREINWKDPGGFPVEQAAELIHQNPDKHPLHELLNQVPAQFRNDVLAIVWESNKPDHRGDRALREAENEKVHEETRHKPGDQLLDWEREKTERSLRFVENVCGPELAYRLENTIINSDNLELRQLRGDPSVYGKDPHGLYVQCIADIPAALEAKQAMSGAPWDQDQLREATRHEVNRMGYRLNLEIQDRLLNQISNERGIPSLARKNGISEETIERISERGKDKTQWATARRAMENPTYVNIEMAAHTYIIEAALLKAIVRGDDAAAFENSKPIHSNQEIHNEAKRLMEEVGKETVDTVRKTLEMAAGWRWPQDGEMKKSWTAHGSTT